MIQPSTLLSLLLAGMGAALTLTGSISAVKIRRTRSVTSLASSQNETQPVREQSMELAEQTFRDSLHEKLARHMGVRAIFSDDESPQPHHGTLSPTTESSGHRGFSKRVIPTTISLAALALYAAAVWQYTVHASIQAWVQAKFSAATYLLNYYDLLAVSAIVALEIFWSQFRKRSRKSSRQHRTCA
jgi:hypothetical protein